MLSGETDNFVHTKKAAAGRRKGAGGQSERRRSRRRSARNTQKSHVCCGVALVRGWGSAWASSCFFKPSFSLRLFGRFHFVIQGTHSWWARLPFIARYFGFWCATLGRPLALHLSAHRIYFAMLAGRRFRRRAFFWFIYQSDCETTAANNMYARS